MQIKESASEHAFYEGIPSSLMLLNIAHEYLGSRSWCTKSDGAFLFCFMDVLKEKMASNQYDKEINQAFEQCVYCLYGHPNKRGRVRQLTDHMVQQIHLTWDRAVDLFEYFKPKTLPEFDSFKSDTISGEVEHLLKKISQLVPEDERAVGVSLEELHNYIEGQTNFPPTMPSERQVKLPILKELYYLLADYYLKVNKEAGKAIKFYLHDLSVNPTRLDAWAGMALARMSQLEQKLSSIDLRMDVPIYKKSIAALRCFKRAVEVDDTNRKLWIEYGSLAYQLHAHSSRQLKWEKWFPFGDELHQIAQDSRQEMLQISYNCYNKASEGEADGTEEKWLTNYMRGKCLEKMRKPPKEYLFHFVKAAKYIHEENAFYPKRITFAYTTPRLAVEALEMYYRLHVAILKYILKSSDTHDYPQYLKYVEEAANSPFARGMEKRHEKKDGRDSASQDENSMPIVTTPHRKTKTYQLPSSDHTYVRQKSNSSSVDKFMSEDSFVATETVPATMATSSASEAPKDVQLGIPMQYPEPQKGIEVCTAKSVSQIDSLKDRIDWGSPSRTEVKDRIDWVSPSRTEVKDHIDWVTPSRTEVKDCIDWVSPSRTEVKDRIDWASPSRTEVKDRIDWVSPSRTEESGKEIASENFSKEIPKNLVLDTPVVQRFGFQQTTMSQLDENILQQGMCKTDAMEFTGMQTDSDKRISVDINVSKDGQSGSFSFPKSEDEIDLSVSVEMGSHLKPDLVGPTGEAIAAYKPYQVADKSPQHSVENRSGPVRYPSSHAFSVSSIHDLSEESEEDLTALEVSSEIEAKKEKPVTSREADGKSDRVEQPMTENESDWIPKMEIDQPELKKGLTASTEEQNYHTDAIGSATDVKTNNAGEKTDTNETPEEVKKEEVAMDSTKGDEYNRDKVLIKEKTRDATQIKSDVTFSEDMVTLEMKSLEKTESKDDKISTTEPMADRRMESDEELKRSIIDRCRAALELCLQRFPTHYKSLYRLAHMYMYSPQHKNLEYARDLLLGNTQWQNLSHMPTQGLFADRKQNNFFQGIWKIPIEEIDRSGSFPTHLNRSVTLLLELLKEQGDFLMLNKVHMQLLRSPDSGKKYLRDAERVYLAKLAYTTALDVIDTETQKLKMVSDEEKKIKIMMDAYKVWEYAAPKTAILGDRINDVLAQAYKAIRKTNATSVLIEQAIRFCRQQQYEQAMRKTNQSSLDGANSEDVKSTTPVSVEKNDTSLSTSPAETCAVKLVSDPQIANKFSSDPITATDLPTQTVSIETGAPSTTNMNNIQSESNTDKIEEPPDDGNNFIKESEHVQRSSVASQVTGAESNKNINSENNAIKTDPVIPTQTSEFESEKSVIYLSDMSEPTTSPMKIPSAGKQHQESIDMLQSSVMDDSSKEVSQSSAAGDLNSTAGDVSQSSMSDDLSQSDDEEDVSQSNVGESMNQSSVADDASQSSMDDDDDSSQSSTAGDELSESNEEQDDLSSESSSGTPDNSSDEDYAVSDDMETETSSDSSFSDLENSQLVRSTPQIGPRADVSSAFPVHLVKNTMATLPRPQLQPKSFQDQFLKAISQSYQSQFIQSVQADISRFQMGAGTSIAGADLSSKTQVTHELINSPDSQGDSKNMPSLPVVEQGMSAESGDDDADDDVIMISSSPEAGARVRQGISVTGTAVRKVLELSKQMDKNKK
ncbi:hypothetical protein CHS0354_015617 [Potamilus streckersoni]|uniref:Calcineurin-binding protein cabin-1 n=1 Tax=Potamilus streckersoni TaxID=2493646 RepID=A0AAE0WBM3_9BIVA|nr:hypothetical protein CHS0354_015617 [Potamilus streckersoni]